MTNKKEKLYFNIKVKHNPYHSYYYKETIRAVSFRGAEQTKVYKEYLKDMKRGRYASIQLQRV
jgi:hypothetical protein